jgi:hypothetical protein
VIGAVASTFAPSLYDGLRERGARQEDWQGTAEKTLPQSGLESPEDGKARAAARGRHRITGRCMEDTQRVTARAVGLLGGNWGA